jgi:glycosyltransferase involved in cell wall biosynthesis
VFRGFRVLLIIPALNEAESIGPLLAEVDRELIDDIVVADNGSRDGTAAQAAAGGAAVVYETRRGYGSACLRAIREGPKADILVFMDGDGSDDPREIELLLVALMDQNADLVIGSRVLGQAEKGALTPVQIFGNRLTCTLVRFFWSVRYSDLGPFRAIRRPAYDRLAMSDPDFGWTIEMQVKAAQQQLHLVEVPVTYRVRRAGKSKVSGTFLGSLRAGTKILRYVLAAKGRELLRLHKPSAATEPESSAGFRHGQ